MAPEAEQRKRRIERKFNSLDCSIKSLIAYLDDESPDVTNAELRLASINTMYNEYIHNHQELVSIKSDHPHVAAFKQLEADYFTIAAKVRKLQTPIPTPLAESTALNNTLNFTERYDMPRLAAIPVPKFDGNQENWVTWKANFQALIHDRPGMAGTVKLSQLSSAVQGLAQLVISEFCLNPSEQNYLLAWEALCKAYDQRRVIINEHFDALLNLSPHANPTAETTASLMYTIRQHVSMLKAMGIAVGEEFVVRILERCLSEEILDRWIERLSSDKYPSLDELYTFVQNSVFKQRELGKIPKKAHPAKRAGANNSAPPSKVAKSSARSLVTTSTSNACPQCGQNHRLYTCEEFEKISMKDKWKLVRDKGLCRNCLYVHLLPCTSEKRCKKKNCGEDHHTFLHTDKKRKGSGNQSSQPVNEATSSGTTKK